MITILRSKLVPPNISQITPRIQLAGQLEKIPSKRITTVTAGGGYGKTTLALQAVNHLALKTVWYRLDASDRDFNTFVSYLVEGLQAYFPGAGDRTLEHLDHAPFLRSQQEAILKVFLQEVEQTLSDDFLLVLDDYHTADPSEEIRNALQFLLENMPQQLHVILLSRSDPGLQLSRFRAANDIIDIRESDLAFTKSEIKHLFTRLSGINLKTSHLETLHRKTGGWVTGLILFYHFAKDRDPEEIDHILVDLKGTYRFIASYMEENIYNLLTVPVQDFLCKTAILSRMNAKFCDELLDIDNSKEILHSLEQDHLFTFAFDEECRWYTYHQLFQEFLRKKLTEKGDSSVRAIHGRAARLWEAWGDEIEAFRHYLAASEFVTACKLLARTGRRKLLKEGRLQLINALIRELPEEHFKKEPWLQYVQARVHELSGRPLDAIRIYNGALKDFAGRESREYEILCLKGLGMNDFLIGDFKSAEKTFSELFIKARENNNFELCLDILGLLIFISSHLGDMCAADHYRMEADILSAGLKDEFRMAWIDLNQGFRYACAGDNSLAIEFGEKVKSSFSDPEFSFYLIMTCHLLSCSSYYLLSFSNGIAHAEEGLRIADEKGIKDINRSWLLMDYALNAMGMGQYEEAIAVGKEALHHFTEFQCRMGQSYVCHVLQQIFDKTGDHATAEYYARQGLRAIEKLDLPMDRGLIKLGLAEMYLRTERLEEAGSLLEESLKSLQPSKLHYCRVYLLLARYNLEKGDTAIAVEKLLSGLALSREGGFEPWIKMERHWIIPLLTEAFAGDRMQGYIKMLLQSFGENATEALSRLRKTSDPAIRRAAGNLLHEFSVQPTAGLQVYCLGKFRVFRGEREITEKQWSGKKAGMLFKILIHERHKGFIPRDVLMELLWPDQSPDKVINRLHVTLSTLRRILEPEIPKKAASSYILREDDGYRLDLGFGGRVDVDVFKKYVEKSHAAVDPETRAAYCLEAENIYGGDYLQEDPYFDLYADERERLRQDYLFVLNNLIVNYEEKAEFAMCIDYCHKYLAVDPYVEAIYRKLMVCYASIGNKRMLSRTYFKCRQQMAEGLDSRPDEETEKLYHRLLSA